MNTFDNFIFSDSNCFAYGCAKAVSEKTTKEINPLLIYGDDGKTHLIEAIRDAYAKNSCPDTVYYTGTDFCNEYIKSLQSGDWMNFRDRTAQASAFFLDGVEELLGRERSQDAILHLLKEFTRSGRQVVITSSSPIHAMDYISEEIKSYLSCGVIAEIKKPDAKLLKALIIHHSKEIGLVIEPNDIESILNSGFTSIRSIIGFLRQCKATTYIVGIDKLNIDDVIAMRIKATKKSH